MWDVRFTVKRTCLLQRGDQGVKRRTQGTSWVDGGYMTDSHIMCYVAEFGS